MNALYWITVLSNLCTLSFGVLSILIIVIILLGTYAFATGTGDYADEEDKAEAKKYYRITKKLALCSIIPTLILTFVPSTKQLYAIYGVGTVIDYAKNSKEVQKLPDNAVKALNVWLENINKNKKDSTNIYYIWKQISGARR